MNKESKVVLPNSLLIIMEITAIAILLFFYCNFHYFKLDSTLLGVFQELLTIPSMLVTLGAPIIGLINWSRSGFSLNNMAFKVVVIGLICFLLLIMSFQ